MLKNLRLACGSHRVATLEQGCHDDGTDPNDPEIESPHRPRRATYIVKTDAGSTA